MVLHAINKLLKEAGELRQQGYSGYFGVGGALLLENITSVLYTGSMACTVAARLVLRDPMVEVSLSSSPSPSPSSSPTPYAPFSSL